MDLDVGTLLMGLFGGLAIFLYGMEKMTESLKLLAGNRMQAVLARMTSNRLKGVLAGTFITAIIQSSSVTTVLIVGFISAGLMSLSQSLGMIMGASIGTTITAQIIAFNVTEYSLLMIAAGFALSFASKREPLLGYGRMIMGLGLIFFGMSVMKDATNPLRDYEPFVQVMRELQNPLLAILFSALFTGLVQSSSATTGVIIVLAAQGYLTLDTGIALVLGANIGTCITAVLAAIGKPREAVRAAVFHVFFNTAGVVIWFGLIPYLADFVDWMSPVAEGLTGTDKLKAETPRKIANAHTVFNVSNTLLFIGFTPVLGRLIERIVPDRKIVAAPVSTRRRVLEGILIQTPSLALEVVRSEMASLGASAVDMVRRSLAPVTGGTAQELRDLRDMDEVVDSLHGELVTYLAQLSRQSLTQEQSQRLSQFVAAANYFESIGDLVETSMVDAGRLRLQKGLTISMATREALAALHQRVLSATEDALEAFATGDVDEAARVIAAKSEIQRLTEQTERHLVQRLAADEPERLAAYRLESEIVESLKRTYYFAKRIAKLVGETAEAPEERERDEEPVTA